ncbi:DUF3124 domain-containing protein [uncultured Olleya sp.]|uniref:DUF3124 domain-containing protein n=1 Tax=uncultured Olleya sp. TaxID=757243 RepID=UPI002593AB00|nr:DUF3124 domain-containing protein [uncultured Olleya sp.]
MKTILFFILILFSFFSCETEKKNDSVPSNNWKNMQWNAKLSDSLLTGSGYLSVYSQIYSVTEHKKHDLTATVSIRNINTSDTIFINKADFYDTKGQLIKSYFAKPIFVKPMQTIEIVINETDSEGGTGANFLFDWSIPKHVNPPYFEGVMITTYGQQGLSFTTQGVTLKK